MTYQNTLIFVDLAADDPAAAGQFYAEVFGWRDDPRPHGVYHRLEPEAGTAGTGAQDTLMERFRDRTYHPKGK